jgi:hypothetical protein
MDLDERVYREITNSKLIIAGKKISTFLYEYYIEELKNEIVVGK